MIIDYNRILLSDLINNRNRNRSKLMKRLIIVIVIGEKKIIGATLILYLYVMPMNVSF